MKTIYLPYVCLLLTLMMANSTFSKNIHPKKMFNPNIEQLKSNIINLLDISPTTMEIADQLLTEYEPRITKLADQLFHQLFPNHTTISPNISTVIGAIGQEKILITNTTTTVSLWSAIYSILWLLSFGVIFSMALCYWAGCEYQTVEATTGRALSTMGLFPMYVTTKKNKLTEEH